MQMQVQRLTGLLCGTRGWWQSRMSRPRVQCNKLLSLGWRAGATVCICVKLWHKGTVGPIDTSGRVEAPWGAMVIMWRYRVQRLNEIWLTNNKYCWNVVVQKSECAEKSRQLCLYPIPSLRTLSLRGFYHCGYLMYLGKYIPPCVPFIQGITLQGESCTTVVVFSPFYSCDFRITLTLRPLAYIQRRMLPPMNKRSRNNSLGGIDNSQRGSLDSNSRPNDDNCQLHEKDFIQTPESPNCMIYRLKQCYTLSLPFVPHLCTHLNLISWETHSVIPKELLTLAQRRYARCRIRTQLVIHTLVLHFNISIKDQYCRVTLKHLPLSADLHISHLNICGAPIWHFMLFRSPHAPLSLSYFYNIQYSCLYKTFFFSYSVPQLGRLFHESLGLPQRLLYPRENHEDCRLWTIRELTGNCGIKNSLKISLNKMSLLVFGLKAWRTLEPIIHAYSTCQLTQTVSLHRCQSYWICWHGKSQTFIWFFEKACDIQ
eukprot:284818400_5